MKRKVSIDRLLMQLCCLVLVAYTGQAHLWADPAALPVQKMPTFTATLTHFQTSTGTTSNLTKVVNVTLQFQNTTKKPLILGYEFGTASVTDDQGNRYQVGRDVHARGMGEIAGKTVDPKFVLQPGESADMMLEMYWMPSRNDIYGTSYTLNLTVREITAINDSQYHLGAERALEFSSLTNGTWTAPLTPIPTDPGPAVLTGAHVNNEGPFSAQVVELKTSKSKSGNNPKHVLTATVQFKNISSAPITLSYEARSGFYIDNLGNRYDHDSETGHTATGIGTTTGKAADPSFVLQPGEPQTAKFELWRYVNRSTAQIGDHDTLYLAIQQLEVLPSQQIREVRQYSLTFPDLTTGS